MAVTRYCGPCGLLAQSWYAMGSSGKSTHTVSTFDRLLMCRMLVTRLSGPACFSCPPRTQLPFIGWVPLQPVQKVLQVGLRELLLLLLLSE
mgnify:CR=1 FL=1